MSIITLEPFVRTGSHALISLYGPSGSGKTLSAIYLARGLVGEKGKIAFLDTETGRGRIYAKDAKGFTYAELTPPFTPERYTESVKTIEAAGFDALVLDSASHEWDGIGGTVETADNNGLKGLVKWANPKARHKKFVNSLLTTRMHLIICLRAKEKMVQRGKEVISDGWTSIQEKNFMYEMTVQLHMTENGLFTIDKCPKDLLGAFPIGTPISELNGRRVAEWVDGGAPIDTALQALKVEAQEAAERGTTVLKAFWGRLNKMQQTSILHLMDNLKSVAAVADEEAAKESASQNQIELRPMDENLSDPFGAPLDDHMNGTPA